MCCISRIRFISYFDNTLYIFEHLQGLSASSECPQWFFSFNGFFFFFVSHKEVVFRISHLFTKLYFLTCSSLNYFDDASTISSFPLTFVTQ